MQRRDVIASNLASVRSEIAGACSAAGRSVDEVTLIAVTKTYPVDDVEILAELGITDVGENKDQEAAPKHAAVKASLRWHFIGQLQRNKAKSVAQYAHMVHSLDRAELASALSRAAHDAGRELEVLIQVNLDPDPRTNRGGVAPEAVLALAEQVQGLPSLRLAGVMGVAPLGVDPSPAFDVLQAVALRVRMDHPNARSISAGMSQDLVQAVAAGATHIRIGSALLGSRSYVG